MRVLKALCCAGALVALLAPNASADDWNKKTFLTFSGPVQVPGVTLPAGTYTFKLADLSGNRHVVQVFDKDEKKIYTTLLAIPNQRMEPSDKPVVLFSERPAGSPQAVKVWYYPGETIGNEFVYPRKQAIEIARSAHTTVLSTNEAVSDNEHMKSAEIARVDETGRVVNDSDKPATTTASADARLKNSSGNASVGTAGPAEPAPAPRRAALPRTSSNLPLAGLASLLAFALAAGLRRARLV